MKKVVYTEADAKAALKAASPELAAVALMTANQWLYHYRSKRLDYYKTAEHRAYADKDPDIRSMRQEKARQAFLRRVIETCTYDPKNPPVVKLRKSRRRNV